MKSLNLIKNNLNQLSTRVSQLEMRKTLILESKEYLDQEIAVVDNEKIARLYKKAKSLIPGLQKSYKISASLADEKFYTDKVKNQMQIISFDYYLLENPSI